MTQRPRDTSYQFSTRTIHKPWKIGRNQKRVVTASSPRQQSHPLNSAQFRPLTGLHRPPVLVLPWQAFSPNLDPCLSGFLSSNSLKRLRNWILKLSCQPDFPHGQRRFSQTMGMKWRKKWVRVMALSYPQIILIQNMCPPGIHSGPEASWWAVTCPRACPGSPLRAEPGTTTDRGQWRLSPVVQRTLSLRVFLLSATLLGLQIFLSLCSFYFFPFLGSCPLVVRFLPSLSHLRSPLVSQSPFLFWSALNSPAP